MLLFSSASMKLSPQSRMMHKSHSNTLEDMLTEAAATYWRSISVPQHLYTEVDGIYKCTKFCIEHIFWFKIWDKKIAKVKKCFDFVK